MIRPPANSRHLLGRAVLAAVLGGVFVVTIGPPTSAQTRPARTKPTLTDAHPCKNSPGFTCSTLTVPLDHSGRFPGRLKLQVATSDNATAPKGVLLYLTGGPGLPGVPFAYPTWQKRLPGLAKNYRLVMLDQRGTGEFGAINCRKMQAEAVSSDIAPPSPAAIRECAKIVGRDRHFYRTDDTVADLELLRRALAVPKMTVDGVSYGGVTAARYTLAHRSRVRRLVLDSAWPFVDPQRDDPLSLTTFRAHRRVLREACASVPGCDWDPVADLAWLVRTRGDGVTLYDLVGTQGFGDPKYAALITAMHKARRGDPATLNKMISDLRSGQPAPLSFISFGLYTATFCADSRFPWGDSSAPPGRRRAALDARVKRLRLGQLYPYDRRTAAGQGFIQRCLPWPVTHPTSEPPRNVTLRVPTLLINGSRDIAGPAEWAVEMATHIPKGKVVVVKGEGHGIQDYERGEAGRNAVYAFLNR